MIYSGPRGFLLILSFLFGNLRRKSADRSAEPTEKKAEAFFSLLSAFRADTKKIKEAVRVAKFAKKE